MKKDKFYVVRKMKKGKKKRRKKDGYCHIAVGSDINKERSNFGNAATKYERDNFLIQLTPRQILTIIYHLGYRKLDRADDKL
jgi:hypothetical protein